MLDGHKNVVYAVAFNNPFADKIVTGSFDRFDNVLRFGHVLSPYFLLMMKLSLAFYMVHNISVLS